MRTGLHIEQGAIRESAAQLATALIDLGIFNRVADQLSWIGGRPFRILGCQAPQLAIASFWRSSVICSIRCNHIHPHDQVAVQPVAVARSRIRQQLAGLCIVDHLVDVDGDAAVDLP